jgi:hypothetical protein
MPPLEPELKRALVARDARLRAARFGLSMRFRALL